MLVVHVLKILWSFLPRRRRIVFGLLVGLLFVAGVAEMASMLFIFGFINGLALSSSGVRHGPVARGMGLVLDGPISDVQYAIFAGSGVILFIVGKNALTTLVHFGTTRFMMKLNQNVSRDLFRAFLLAPYKMIKTRGVRHLQRQVHESFRILNDCFVAAAQILADSTTLVMVAGLLLFVDPVLTLTAAAIFGGVGSALYWTMQHHIRILGDQSRDATRRADTLVSEGLHGIIDTRLRQSHEQVVRRYSKELGRSSRHTRRLMLMEKMPRATNEILLTSMIVGTVLYLALSRQNITDVVPTIALFGFAGMRVTGAMTRINVSTQALRQRAEAFDKFINLIRKHAPSLLRDSRDGPPALTYLLDVPESRRVVFDRTFESISFSAVSFRYEKDVPVLQDISLEVRRGRFVAFCGPSGGGKSTLLLVFLGLLKPTEGEVLCDGLNIRRDLLGWHRLISYVGQDYYLSDGTVRDNVAFGAFGEEIDDERVWRALRLSCADEFVAALPQKLDTLLVGGRNLSGGQRQRIAIARALYSEPEILVLDEATAALDNETERAIAAAISRISKEKTVVCVAHRLSTIRNSDEIHFVSHGRVLASGTYDKLLETCPEFERMAGLVEAQQEPVEGESRPQ